MKKYLIFCGDKRCYYIAEYFKKMGEEVYTLNVPGTTDNVDKNILDDENFYDGVNLVLPVPVANFLNTGDIKNIVENIKRFSGVCGGVIPEAITIACLENNIPFYDYMKDDEVAVKNAVATAEGAIAEAFMMSEINICESKSLVTGYGRCGMVLAKKLAALGSTVTVTARSVEACIKAEMDGFETILMKKLVTESDLDKFDFCFNTVPALILTEDILCKFSKEIIIMDIASKPGGTDFEYCNANNIKYKHSLGIPGKYSPKTSGYILAEAIKKSPLQ